MVAYVYILASKPYGTLYVGVTSDIGVRLYQHKNKLIAGFTSKYEVDQLVYLEAHDSIEIAIRREKAIKEWKREWKLNLIKGSNPDWSDLSNQYLSA